MAFVWELTKETLNLPLSCVQGVPRVETRRQRWRPSFTRKESTQSRNNCLRFVVSVSLALRIPFSPPIFYRGWRRGGSGGARASRGRLVRTRGVPWLLRLHGHRAARQRSLFAGSCDPSKPRSVVAAGLRGPRGVALPRVETRRQRWRPSFTMKEAAPCWPARGLWVKIWRFDTLRVVPFGQHPI